MHAKDRGCTAPGCTVSGYCCEVHHVVPWAERRQTDVNGLTFGCGCQHRLIKDGGWATRKNNDHDTEWIPPPHLDRGQPRINFYHHPEKLLREEEGNDDEDDP